MKVILFLKYDHSGFMYEWDTYHYYDELKQMGYSINEIRVPYGEKGYDVCEELIKYLENNTRPSLICSALDDNSIGNDFKSLCFQYSIPTLLICFDNLSVPYKHKKSANIYDLVWLTSVETECFFKEWGANTCFLPYAANPKIFKPSGYENGEWICFIGSLYGARLDRVNTLIKKGIPIKIYGNRKTYKTPLTGLKDDFWEKLTSIIELSKFSIGRKCLYGALKKSLFYRDVSLPDDINIAQDAPVSFEQISEIFHTSSLCLSVSELWNTHLISNPVHKLHLRTFEIPMSGGIQFAPRVPELQSYFLDRVEAVYYSTEEEMIDLAKFYLRPSNYSNRQKIKEACRYRAEHEHTWAHRFGCIFNNLSI